MTAWSEFEAAAPELADRVRTAFTGRRHHTLATLRADGSPRISGIEVGMADGVLSFGSMASSRKGADLLRDPRFALHSATVDPVEGAHADWPGESKIAGRARPDGPLIDGPDGLRFLVEIDEVVHTRLNPEATLLVVEWWSAEHGLRRAERA